MRSPLVQQPNLKRQPTLENYGFTNRTYTSTRGITSNIEVTTENDRMTVWHLNIAGLWDKLERLKTIIYNSPEKPDIIGL